MLASLMKRTSRDTPRDLASPPASSKSTPRSASTTPRSASATPRSASATPRLGRPATPRARNAASPATPRSASATPRLGRPATPRARTTRASPATPRANGNRTPPPVFTFSPGGRLVNNVVTNAVKPALPAPNVACRTNAATTGLRGERFRTCFTDHLRTQMRPMFAAMNAAKGNQTKMDAQCSQASIAPHQLVIYEIAKLMATVPTEQLGEHRGLLAFYGTGSGKTVSSLAIIMAFWASDKKIIIVSSKSNTAQAMMSYRREAPRFFPKEVAVIAAEYKKRKRASDLTDTEAFSAALDERVKGLTFVEARNRIAAKSGEFKTVKAIPLHEGGGSVMIIDEAQGLAVKSRADPQGDAIKLGCALRRLPSDKLRKIRVFAMTATPGNSIKQWLKLLSVVRRADQAPFTLDNDAGTNGKGRRLCEPTMGASSPGRDDAARLEKLLRGATGPPPAPVMKYVRDNLFGLVAYVDIRSDQTRHACVTEVVKRIPMDSYYYLSLLKFNAMTRLRANRAASEIAQQRFDPRMPDAFMKRMRVYSHTLPKTVWVTLPKEVQQRLIQNRRILKVTDRGDGRLVSPKFVMLAQYLGKTPGKQYCYTVSGNEFVLGKALSKWYGFVDVTRRAEAFDGVHYNRKTNAVVGLSKGNHMIILNDTTTKEHRERLVGIFNSPANVRGEYIRIIIASGQLYEGLDLTGLRHVHLADPLPTPLQEVQAIGRGPRNCAHRGLPLTDRTVAIVRWFSSAPRGGWAELGKLVAMMKGVRGRITPETLKEEYERLGGQGYDDFVFTRARDDPDFLILHNWERIMQAMAIDCQVLSRYHRGITCGSPTLVSKVAISAGAPCSA